jgi:tight adherence protein B
MAGGVNPVALVVGLAVFGGAALARGAGGARYGTRIRRRLGPPPQPRARRLPGPLARLAAALASALVDAEIPLNADRAWLAWIALAAAGAVCGVALGGPVLAVGGALLGGAAPVFVVRARRGTAASTAEAALPGALEAVARSLRSGGSLRQAVAEAADATPGNLGAELRLVAAATERGAPLVDALDAWHERCPRSGVRLAVAALCLGAETGGAQARAVDGVAATLRDRLAVEGEVRALTSQTRASMLVIAAAPVAFCFFASSTDSRTSTFLFRSPIGLACLTAGIALDVIGAFWMRGLCRIAP